MEDDENNTEPSPHPSETLVSESVPPPALSEDVGDAAAPEIQSEAEYAAVSKLNGAEPSDDVAADRVSELGDSSGVQDVSENQPEAEETPVVEPSNTEVTGDVEADKVSGEHGGDAVRTGMEIKPEAEVVESGLGVLEIRSQHVDKGTGETEFAGDFQPSGLVPGSVGAQVADGESVTVGSEAENGEGDALMSGASFDEIQPAGKMEKLMVGDECDEKDDVVGKVAVVTEKVGDLRAGLLINLISNDVAIRSEFKSGVAGGMGSFPILDDVARENLSTGTDSVMETGLEGANDDVPKESPIIDEGEIVHVKSPVTDDMATEVEVPKVGTEMEIEKEVVGEVQEDAMVEERGFSQMEVEDDMANKDSLQLEDEAIVEGDEHLVGTEMETDEKDIHEVAEEKGVGEGGKSKRGKNSKVPSKAPARKVVEEDVCFICFDGGDLVLCDHRGCPKAYHASCVDRDEAFFRAKGRWECGCHQCTNCGKKNPHYMCYTCTFSLCKECIKGAVISCVRDDKGFCEACMKTVLSIENSEGQANEEQLDFDDKSSWLYLFKDYWLSLKQRLSLSLADIAQAKNPVEESDALSGKRESPEEAVDGSNNQDSSPDSQETQEAGKNRRRTSKRLKSSAKEVTSPSAKKDSQQARKWKRNSTSGTQVAFKPDTTEWASKELLEFVMHMKNGDKSAISQFDVQALLLEYIKINKLRDPRRKSQIICDSRLQSLFGKPRVGHFEMLKLLESHFLTNEDPQMDDSHGTVVDDESNELDVDGTIDTSPKGGKDKKRKYRKKGQNRERQSNLDDYAAIDMHNIGLIFLRRKLVEDLLEDEETFCDKVVGTFVRIRISGNTQKQDIYRLVQVLGTGKAAEPYKVGKRITDLMLEILNLNKKELVPIDTISNQEFTEEECKRLRQSIKCGLTNRLTVGDILEKAEEIQAARVNDWMESEIVRLSHLRDRASEKGRRKELRECVEKLQLLKTPEERRRRLDEVPEVHVDPNMDPDHESEEHDSEEEDSKQEFSMKPRGSAFSRRGREPISPRGGNFSPVDSWSGSRQNSGKNYEVTRNLSNAEFSNKNDESVPRGRNPYESSLNYIEMQQANVEKAMSPINSVNVEQSSLSFARSESFSGAASEIPRPSLPAVVPEPAIKVNESEKMWHYKDPAGKVQGPFSIVQLRKWSKNGYFPTDMRIWKNTETEDDSILLTNALDGNFLKQPVLTKNNPPAHSAWGSLSVEVPKDLVNKPNDSFNPPSPTPNATTPVWNKEQSSETPHSASSVMVQTPNFVQPNQNGNQENISPASLLNSARQLMSGFENNSINSPSVGPTMTQPSAVTNDPQAAVGATPQNLDPNSSYSMPTQQQQAGYNPWVAAVPVPPNVQNPSGSFPMPGYAPIPQPVPGNQPPFPTQVPPNIPWGMGMIQNPNMGWGMGMGMGMGMVQGNPNMNWAPMANPGWVAPAGNPGAMVPPMPPGGNVNPGAMVPPMPPGGNVNQGWVAPPVNQGWAPMPGNVNQGWGTGPPPPPPPGNQNSGKGNSGNSGRWGAPPGNSNRRGKEGHRSGNRYSGPRDRGGEGRPYQPPKYDSYGNRICPYFLDGYCKKGSRCDMVHQNLPDKM